jgi:hypothetical protein
LDLAGVGHIHLAAHAGFVMARYQTSHLQRARFGEGHHQLSRLSSGDRDGRARAVLVVGAVRFALGGIALHGFGMFTNGLVMAQHHFVHNFAGVVHHKADGFTRLNVDLAGREAHLVVHAHFDAATDHLGHWVVVVRIVS